MSDIVLDIDMNKLFTLNYNFDALKDALGKMAGIVKENAQ